MDIKPKDLAKRLLIKLVPLGVRKSLAIRLCRQSWIDGRRKNWWAQELVKDLKEKNINAYHKFLWANHLSYAESYEVDERFGYENLKGSRKLLFDDVEAFFNKLDLKREKDIRSVLEVGCSLGYLLRFMEKGFFPSANCLMGIDIDKDAIAKGTQYLKSKNSIVKLKAGDMAALNSDFKGKSFDAVFCLGVLMYLNQEEAQKVIRLMLCRTNKVLILSGLAHPSVDNKNLQVSETRKRDSSLIHNFDEMVLNEGGEVLYRRWEGDRMVDNNSIYFVFARQKTHRI